MDSYRPQDADPAQASIARLRSLFPDCVSETRDPATGESRLHVDFERLRQVLGSPQAPAPESATLDWPGKRDAHALADTAPRASLSLNPDASEAPATTGNMIVSGDNLEALKLLRPGLSERVKAIYIDPPYNTGADLIYRDSFDGGSPGSITEPHANWLSMLYPRLRLARDLLTPDGVIIVHIDEHEYPNLEKIMGEIFGEANALGTIVWDKRNPKGDATKVAQQHEYITLYARDITTFRKHVDFRRPKANAQMMLDKARALLRSHGGANDKSRAAYRAWLSRQDVSGGEKAYHRIDDDGHVYRTVSMAWPNRKPAPEAYFTPLIHPVTGRACPVPRRGWRNPPGTMQALLAAGQIVFGPDETTQPTRKYRLCDNMYEKVPSLLYHAGSDDALLARMGLHFDNPKPVALIRRLLQTVCRDDDIVLDFFAGSGSTGHAVLELNAAQGSNLRYILIQRPEPIPAGRSLPGVATIAELCQARMRAAAAQIAGGEAHEGWRGDTGFRLLELLPEGSTANEPAMGRLFRALCAQGHDPTLPLREERLAGSPVWIAGERALLFCPEPTPGPECLAAIAAIAPGAVLFPPPEPDAANMARLRAAIPGAEILVL